MPRSVPRFDALISTPHSAQVEGENEAEERWSTGVIEFLQSQNLSHIDSIKTYLQVYDYTDPSLAERELMYWLCIPAKTNPGLVLQNNVYAKRRKYWLAFLKNVRTMDVRTGGRVERQRRCGSLTPVCNFPLECLALTSPLIQHRKGKGGR